MLPGVQATPRVQCTKPVAILARRWTGISDGRAPPGVPPDVDRDRDVDDVNGDGDGDGDGGDIDVSDVKALRKAPLTLSPKPPPHIQRSFQIDRGPPLLCTGSSVPALSRDGPVDYGGRWSAFYIW